MNYELLHDHTAGTQETVAYTMVLRRQRSDNWLIQSHMLAGVPALPETKKASAAATPPEAAIKQ